jgi:hypothetical protein
VRLHSSDTSAVSHPEPGLIVVLGVSAGSAIWWKLRKRRKVREREKSIVDLERVKKKKVEVAEKAKKLKLDLEKAEASAREVMEEELRLEAKLH